MDRIILYPILGGENVTIYYVASFYGKLFCMIITPISSVLLSYYVKKNKMNVKEFWQINIVVMIISLIIYFLGLVIAKPMVRIIYPNTINLVSNYYLYIANLAAIISGISSIVQTSLLKFCKLKWQFIVQIVYTICYIVGIIAFVKKYQLLGFCFVTLMADIIRLTFMLIVGTIELKLTPRRENEICL